MCDANIVIHRSLKQRADYTHKHNSTMGRFGWLRLTPAYSLKVVDEILSEAAPGDRVLDPFSGTATTPLCAAYMEHQACAVEINPFLVWLGRAKSSSYDCEDADGAFEGASQALRVMSDGSAQPVKPPPLHNIARWWGPQELGFLCSLKGALENAFPLESKSKTLLKVAFCRTLIKLSNAAFNHQSMSFRDDNGQVEMFEGHPAEPQCSRLFMKDVELVLASALDNPKGTVSIAHGDSREVRKFVAGGVNLVITSPPYPNRMSYVRELRPYMYWLDFLSNPRDAAELDWKSIGGTWGVATSRLGNWKRSKLGFCTPYLEGILLKIAQEANANGRLLSNYVARYFEDAQTHLSELRHVLARGARIHYVVGNSTFYGVLVPVEQLYSDIIRDLGFKDITVTPIRKRNSKKELVEFVVSAIWTK